jgi:hypothetical protein
MSWARSRTLILSAIREQHRLAVARLEAERESHPDFGVDAAAVADANGEVGDWLQATYDLGRVEGMILRLLETEKRWRFNATEGHMSKHSRRDIQLACADELEALLLELER